MTRYFDAVVMLTWSDWKSEPRSNRYHYATRFARELPVLFVEPWGNPGTPLSVEQTEVDGVDIVHASRHFDKAAVLDFLDMLRARGIRKPLLWIYSCLHYQPLIDALPRAMRVYHATEDYFTESPCWSMDTQEIAVGLKRLLAHSVDLVVAVSEGVVQAYRKSGNFSGASVVIENGCDAGFFFDLTKRTSAISSTSNDHIAIYQGGINKRLDFELLHRLLQLLPDWQFWFCGVVDENSVRGSWELLKSLSNVRYFGVLEPTQLGELMCRATVGLIPFIQCDSIRNSLPLKAYEYVACGLPVVTVPIEALSCDPKSFTFARTADEFACAIQNHVMARWDQELLRHRTAAALQNSYDSRFTLAVQAIVRRRAALQAVPRKLNVALLYDDRWMHVSTLAEHAGAFKKYSRHNIFYVPASINWPLRIWPFTDDSLSDQIDLSLFDVLILHYSVRLSMRDHLSEGIARQIEHFDGLKVLFIQDEYEGTEIARRWMERLRFDVVYTCVPEAALEYVYPTYRFPGTDFLPTITGYVPEDPYMDCYALPLGQRKRLIGYRGRVLPHVYGTLGLQKYRIGIDVRRLAEERGLPVDIEVDDAKRIYGTDWYRFLGSVRATLGTESGSNVFDFEGSLHAAFDAIQRRDPAAATETIEQLLPQLEGRVKMNQISPKIFEAIRLRTALILFEGEYSGAVKPGLHYIPLRTDYSNIDEVFSQLQDLDFVERLTQRAYDDIIGSERYSYRCFVQKVDTDIESRLLHGPRYTIYATPVLACSTSGEMRSVVPTAPLGWALSTSILSGKVQREQIAEHVATRMTTKITRKLLRLLLFTPRLRNILVRCAELMLKTARAIWRMLPVERRKHWRAKLAAILNDQSCRIVLGVFRPVWNMIPLSVRQKLSSLVHGT